MNFGRSIRVNRGAVLVVVVCGFTLLYFYHLFSDRSGSAYGQARNANEVNLRKLLIGAIQAAQKGGVEIVEVSKSMLLNKKSKGKTKEGADDPVTDADARSHCVMKNGLHRIFPRLEIISEEDKGTGCGDTAHFNLDPTVLHENAVIPDEVVETSDVTVWIDPLDATQEYTEKLYQYVTTMVCVAIRGKPVIGVVHNPFTMKTTWAWHGKALSEDLSKVKKEETLTKNPIIIVSRSHSGLVQNISKQVFGDNAQVIKAAGAGYKVLQVVFNNATAYLHTTRIKKWDLCAGNAILNAVGGKMTNLMNEEIDYSSNEAVVNDKGLLSTLSHHEDFISKIMSHKVLQA
ncbi:unnamed protein product [Hermetia illucens]|uniref:Putative inositol monophosphatase 3 n=1 Tax=Hermetia illucens TaxID=343691 RepID=A0A7R8UZV8_HERIL|nr:putative inositol monophosphatase 3 [Hermetia illucens]CAD7090205.1 unnamed protein product [Hermetia illucens]